MRKMIYIKNILFNFEFRFHLPKIVSTYIGQEIILAVNVFFRPDTLLRQELRKVPFSLDIILVFRS